MQFFSIAISGAVSGAIYALLAIGLVLSHSTSRIFNFGHAATAFASAYLYHQFHVALGWNKWLTLLVIVAVFAPLMGWAWDRLVFRRLADAEESTKIVAGVGVLIVVPAFVLLVCAILRDTLGIPFQDVAEVYQVPGVLPAQQHQIAEGLVLSNNQLVALGASILLFVTMWAFLRFTPIGLHMRTAVDSPVLARLRGINTGRVSTLSWVISFFLAAVAGVLAAPFPGPFGLVNDNYTLALFVATTAAVVAGLRSVPLAFLAGLLIGAVRNIVVAYVNADYLGAFGAWAAKVYGLTASVPYAVLFIALILIGHDRKRRKAGTAATAAKPTPDYRDDLSPFKKALPWIIKSAVILVPALFLANGIWRQLFIYGFALGIILLSFTIVTGLGGMVSLAQGAFATAAGLTVGLLLANDWHYVPATVVGVLVAAGLGALTALPALRLSGLSLTFATLALALLATNVLFKMEWFSNGTAGWSIPRPRFGPIDLGDDRVLLIAVFLVVLLMVWMANNLTNSAAGRAMIAVRTAEPAASASAVSPPVTKLLIFVISAAVAGLGGVLAVTVYGTILNTANPPQATFLWLAIVVIVGVRSPGGAIEAGIISAVLPWIMAHGFDLGPISWGGTSNDLIPQVLFGLGAIQLAAQPNGLLATQSMAARHRRDRKRAKLAAQAAAESAAASAAVSAVPSAAPSAGGTGAGDVAQAAPEPAIEVTERGAPAAAAPAAGGSPGLLELHGVHAAYGEVEVLHGIDLSVREGAILALLGANGSGKTTLCATIAGLVPVTSGRIVFDGEDITALDTLRRVGRGLVLVPESRGVFPSITVDENLSIWLPSKADRAKVYEQFESLARRAGQPAGNLSGGEQQMLSLAPFLVRRPRLLISDEPSLGLAQLVTAEIMAAFQRLQQEGTTVVLVEEKARDVLTVADQVGALQTGHLRWVSERADVDEQRVAAAYLGMSAVVH
ncbi:High-affinity branched-chain amino acid transport ATP-binding protein LivF [Nonomuraea coxensis DSM 45129]|uniref:High-affinity branched-chain amino acid transport ATP-binding protein LivF n=1 Tax=Nonomuraea coxensis DSM 45129 TaxID=1122611 RepID=A0ABX8U1V2_9ACTN|nr:ATP-binding cassette domain-containing protein [Nonomuraea coxensis]QYC41543.1 High-affinity branched-chain amino acid transport ATP-binding protein LivF [Nonomuraea coxensis DSM 45129]